MMDDELIIYDPFKELMELAQEIEKNEEEERSHGTKRIIHQPRGQRAHRGGKGQEPGA
jgi:hypothetical protein